MNDTHWVYSNCPWGICNSPLEARLHQYCKAVLRAQLKKFVEDEYPSPIDPELEHEKYIDFMNKWRQDHPMDTMMDNGTRVYNWRATYMGPHNWRIDVGY